MSTPTNNDLPPAVVVGLCAHGLCVVRALARQGVKTHALEANAALPGTRTQYATVHLVPDINGYGLIEALKELRPKLGGPLKPILFLTNDNMVRQVADNWPQLEDQYALSWSGCRRTIGRLVMKAELESRCAQVSVLYPRTWNVAGREALSPILRDIAFPVIAKPVKPLSSFKARVLRTTGELERLVDEYSGDLPFLVQDWIPGDETRLSFCAFYLDKGKVLARFDGRKLRSRPMGHTTVAEPVSDEDVFQEAIRFFHGLDITGPASLEMKRDDLGRLWVIEPTLGRTDFWLGCCVANGINLPYVEYAQQAGLDATADIQKRRYVWFNLDRDPMSLVWYGWKVLSGALPWRRGAFLYFAVDDPSPFFHSVVRDFRNLGRRALNKMRSFRV